MNQIKNKYFLLYLKTGGGHLAPAKAVSDYINKTRSEIETVLIDGLAGASETSKFVVEDGYRIVQKNARWLYEFLYAFYHIPLVTRINDLIYSRSIKPYLEKRILEEKPDKIIIFHFFLISHVYSIIKKHSLSIKILTVVTDPFTAHPFWFVNKNQEFLIFSERLRQSMLKKNIPEKRIHVFPFLLNENFTRALTKTELEELRIKHGFLPGKKSILVFGGGDGIPKGMAILKNLINNKIDANIAVICGKNKTLFDNAVKLKSEHRADNLFIYGFIDYVYELLSISDIIITKAGASATKEILALKKVPVIISYIWGQELGNVQFVVKNKMGIYQRDVSKVSAIIKKLLTDDQFYCSFIHNIETFKLQNGTPLVSDFIITY